MTRSCRPTSLSARIRILAVVPVVICCVLLLVLWTTSIFRPLQYTTHRYDIRVRNGRLVLAWCWASFPNSLIACGIDREFFAINDDYWAIGLTSPEASYASSLDRGVAAIPLWLPTSGALLTAISLTLQRYVVS